MHAVLSERMTGFATSGHWDLLVAMLPVGIIFGAVHAMTPGHGKAILAGYLVGAPLSALRASAIAMVQVATHIGTAVLIALLALPLISRTLGHVGRAPSLELLSRASLIAIGLWLIARAMLGLGHAHANHPCELSPREHADLGREGIGVAIVAGLIPCPLTLFSLVMAGARGVPAAGVAFALAMILGVGATLAVVALVTVVARERVATLMARYGASMARLSRWLNALSGLAIAALAARELIV